MAITAAKKNLRQEISNAIKLLSNEEKIRQSGAIHQKVDFLLLKYSNM